MKLDMVLHFPGGLVVAPRKGSADSNVPFESMVKPAPVVASRKGSAD